MCVVILQEFVEYDIANITCPVVAMKSTEDDLLGGQEEEWFSMLSPDTQEQSMLITYDAASGGALHCPGWACPYIAAAKMFAALNTIMLVRAIPFACSHAYTIYIHVYSGLSRPSTCGFSMHTRASRLSGMRLVHYACKSRGQKTHGCRAFQGMTCIQTVRSLSVLGRLGTSPVGFDSAQVAFACRLMCNQLPWPIPHHLLVEAGSRGDSELYEL